ncbi:MAG: hypothetical protein UR26_C0006G0018 [candidate division TM6 bacterium GW2011_GWF2_32_72]|nr:MAG: hypothetical protein UR26_C0006G0018 [candidate division TM6 bacterium GW2011_GWF2_32_72]
MKIKKVLIVATPLFLISSVFSADAAPENSLSLDDSVENISQKKAESKIKLDKIKFTHPIIKVINETAGLLQLETVGKIFKLRAHIQDIIIGKMDPKTKKREGLFQIGDKKFSLQDLVKLEKDRLIDLQPKRSSLMDLYEDDKDLFDAEWNKLVDGHDLTPILNAGLKEVMDEFIKTNQMFISYVQAMKDIVKELVDEYVKEGQLENSYLKIFAYEKNGKEVDRLKKEVKSFEDFNNILTEINMFLGSFLYSIPDKVKLFMDKYVNKPAK